jgi:Leucine-rich repeat (LRR) protein
LAGSIPTEFGELINLTYLTLRANKLSGTPSLLISPGVVVRVYHLLENVLFALAGSIPTEFGELINLTDLCLNDNQLSGTPSLLILPGVVVRVYHVQSSELLHYEPVVVEVQVVEVQVVWCKPRSAPTHFLCRIHLVSYPPGVVSTWRTGRQEFKALMKTKAPACSVSV